MSTVSFFLRKPCSSRWNLAAGVAITIVVIIYKQPCSLLARVSTIDLFIFIYFFLHTVVALCRVRGNIVGVKRGVVFFSFFLSLCLQPFGVKFAIEMSAWVISHRRT